MRISAADWPVRSVYRMLKPAAGQARKSLGQT